jgi:hypothetical protein
MSSPPVIPNSTNTNPPLFLFQTEYSNPTTIWVSIFLWTLFIILLFLFCYLLFFLRLISFCIYFTAGLIGLIAFKRYGLIFLLVFTFLGAILGGIYGAVLGFIVLILVFLLFFI